MSSNFTKYHTFDRRKSITNKVSETYPDRIAVVIIPQMYLGQNILYHEVHPLITLLVMSGNILIV